MYVATSFEAELGVLCQKGLGLGLGQRVAVLIQGWFFDNEKELVEKSSEASRRVRKHREG